MNIDQMLEAVSLLIAHIEKGLLPNHPDDHKFSSDLDEPGLCGICGWYSLSDTDLRQASTAALNELQAMHEILTSGIQEDIEEIYPQLIHLFPEEEKGIRFVYGSYVSFN